MSRLAVPTLLACAALAGAVAGCGSDDGIATRDAPELNAPAAPADTRSGDGVPALEGDDLLYPRKTKQPRRKRARDRSRTTRRRENPRKARSKPRQQVAGAVRSKSRRGGSLTGSPGEPPRKGPEIPSRKPGLSEQQQADLAAVRTTLEELFHRMNARDASICTDLMTQRHVEQATGKSGAAAVEQCHSDVANSKLRYSLNKISGIRIVGDLGWIRFASSAGDYARWQVLRAVRSGDGWKFDGDGSEDV